MSFYIAAMKVGTGPSATLGINKIACPTRTWARIVFCSILFVALLLCAIGPTGAALSAAPTGANVLAPAPPMGWNSWDGFGATIGEAQVRATADAFAKNLKPSGWQYVVLDMGWYLLNPTTESNKELTGFSMDGYGRFTPAANRFPSAAPPATAPDSAANFKPLVDYLHSLGLKFGIHILRGIPRQAVDANLPIANSPYHARDAANTSDTCVWNTYTYGLDASKPAAQAYYDSVAALYASWGVDFIKVDCISSGPYRGDEIRMLSTAIAKSGRPMVLSLSPGPAPLEKIDEMRQYAQMWRISNDIWDLWHSDSPYPQGVGDQFANAAKWAGLAQPGHWPDADMLPLGRLGPAPGWGQPRDTRLTHDEQRTLLTLWCIFHSPLMLGGDITQLDPWTLSLLTNPEVIAVDQHAGTNAVAYDDGKLTVWTAKAGAWHDVAVFNRSDAAQDVDLSCSQLGLPQGDAPVRDLWERKDLGPMPGVRVHLAPHASVLYGVGLVAAK